MENEPQTSVPPCCQGNQCQWNGKMCGKWCRKNRCGRGCGCGIGGLWCIGWLFTIGFLQLTFWKGVLAIAIWPYYIGTFLR